MRPGLFRVRHIDSMGVPNFQTKRLKLSQRSRTFKSFPPRSIFRPYGVGNLRLFAHLFARPTGALRPLFGCFGSFLARYDPGRKLLVLCKFLEARGGIEPPNKGFADLCLTTWLPRPCENEA
jgi:hypothetical protein